MERMTDGEIVREYNSAKNKAEQVKILADLNLTTADEIRQILEKNGITTKAEKRGRPKGTKLVKKDKGTKAANDMTEEIKGVDTAVHEHGLECRLEPIKISVLPAMPPTVREVLTKQMVACQNAIDKNTQKLKEIHEFMKIYENEKVG